MIDFLFLNKITIILVDALGIWLAFWVYSSNRKAKINRLFTLVIVFALLWITLCYFSGISVNNLELSLFLGRLAYGAAILFLIPFYFFSISFIDEKERFPYLKIIIPIGGLIISWFSIFTNFMAEEMTSATFGEVSIGVVPVLGKGKFFWFGFASFVALFVLTRLIGKYLKSAETKKTKLQYFLLGILIFVIANIVFNIILAFWAGDARYYQIGNYSVIFLLGFTAFAIVKRQLFEIKVVLTQLLVGFIAILLLVNVVGSESAFEYIWKGSLFVAFLVTGGLLIKSVLNEIRRREQLEKVTAQLRIANVELKKLDQAKTEFLAVASHQLRTPLTAIRGYLSMLRRGDYGQVPTDFVDPLREVYQSTLRLAKLTNRLLNATRIETGQLKINLGPVSLGGLISSVVDELKPQAKEKNLYLKFLKPKEKLPPLPLDLEKIRQVFLNIIDNGLKYTQKGGIEISLGLVGVDRVQVKIQDTGEGMAKEELKKIFQSFSRGLAGEKFHTAGAGLGLYIAKEFIELHQGKIWATSPGAGKGTTIWIEFPLTPNQAKAEKDPTSFPGGKRKKTSR